MRLNATTDIVELREGIAADLARMADPLSTRLRSVDELIAERLEDLAALRAARAEIVRAIRPIVGEDAIPIEPGRKAKPGPRQPGPSQRHAKTRIGEDRIALVLDHLRNRNGDGDLEVKDVSEALSISKGSARAALELLVEREQVRITQVHRGPQQPTLYAAVE